MVSDRERIDETLERITRAAGAFAIDQGAFYRTNLGRLMRRAVAQGVPRELVIALSVLPIEEAETLIGPDLAGCRS